MHFACVSGNMGEYLFQYAPMTHKKIWLGIACALLLAMQIFAANPAYAKSTPAAFYLDDSIHNGETLEIMLPSEKTDLLDATLHIDALGVDVPLTANSDRTFWRGSWSASGLTTDIYTTTLRLTYNDDRGQVTTAGPSFSDPVFGNTTPGTTAYSNGQIRHDGKIDGRTEIPNPMNFQVDEANGYGYVMSYGGSSESLIKFSLTDPTDTQFLTFPVEGGWYQGSRLSPDGAYYYVLPYNSDKVAYKVDTATMTIVGSLALAGDLGYVEESYLDTVGGFLYLASDHAGGAYITKIDVANFTLVTTLTLNATEEYPTALMYNAGTLYVGLVSNPSIVSVDTATMTRTSAVTYPNPELSQGFWYAGNQTPIAGFYYLSVYRGAGPHYIAKIDATTLALTSLMTLGLNEKYPTGYAYDGGTTLYFSGYIDASNNNYISSIDLTTFTRNGTTVTTDYGDYRNLHYSTTESKVLFAAQDPTTANWYLNLRRFNPSTLAETSNMPAQNIDTYSFDYAIDEAAGFGYTLQNTSPISIGKFDLATRTRVATLQLSAALTLNAFESKMYLDASSGRLYVGVYDPNAANNDYIYTIALSNFTEVGATNIGPARDVKFMTIDPNNNYLYALAKEGTAWKVVRMDRASLTFVMSSNLAANYVDAAYLSYDPTSGYLYGLLYDNGFAVWSLVQMTTTGSVINSVNLAPGDTVGTAYLDTTQRVMSVATRQSPAKLLTFNIDSMTSVSSLTLNAGQNDIKSMTVDTASQIAYLLTKTAPAQIVKVNMQTMANLGAIVHDEADHNPVAISYDATRGNVYTLFELSGVRLRITKASHKGSVWATKVTLASPATNIAQMRFYSHEAAGNLRLALYDSSKNLVWQSGSIANTAAGTWVRASISGGTPSSLASLAAGDYWLAFQTDSNKPVASYTAGAAGSGLFLSQDFATFPGSIAAGTLTAQNYTVNVVYDTGFLVTQTGGTTVITEGGPNDTYSIVLTGQPSGNVDIALSATGGVQLSPNNLTFTSGNWNTPQTVTVSIPDNATPESNRVETISHVITAAAFDYGQDAIAPISVTVVDPTALPTAGSVVGVTSIGSTNYPDGGFTRISGSFLPWGGASNRTMTVDTVNGSLVMGGNTFGGLNKVDLGSFTWSTALPTSEDLGEVQMEAGAIDEVNHIGYYVADGATPTRIIKFRTTDMEHIQTAALPLGDVSPRRVVLDTANDMMYIYLKTSPSKVVKVRMSTLEKVGQTVLDAMEDENYTLVLGGDGFAYLAGTTSNTVYKINTSTMVVAARLTLPAPNNGVYEGFQKPVGGKVYFLAYPTAGLLPLNLATFTFDATIPLATAATSIRAVDVDVANAKGYIGQAVTGVTKINLLTGASEGNIPTTVGALRGMSIDATNQFGYFTEEYANDGATTVDLKKFNLSTMALVSTLSFPSIQSVQAYSVLNNPNGAEYFVAGQYNRPVLSKFNKDTMQRVASFKITDGGTNEKLEPVYDTTRDMIYWGADKSGATADTLLKIDPATMTQVGSINLNAYNEVTGGVIDATGTFGYFLTKKDEAGTGATSNTRVIKVNLATFMVDSTFDLAGGYNQARRPVLASDGMMYFGVQKTTAPSGPHLIKFNTATMTQVGDITLTDESFNMVLDEAHNTMYLLTYAFPAAIVPVDLGTFTTGAGLTLPADMGMPSGITLDAARDLLYVLVADDTTTWPDRKSYTIKIQRSPLAVLGSLQGRYWENEPEASFLDIARGALYNVYYYAYIGPVAKILPSFKGATWGTKVTLTETTNVVDTFRFYAHNASGNARLALYDASMNLVWESTSIAMTGNDMWYNVNVSDGTPTALSLAAGTYWLAFQTDDMSLQPGYTLGSANTGFYIPSTFGAFPSSLASTTPTYTTRNFSMAMTVNVGTSLVQSGGSTSIVEGAAGDTYSVVLNSQPGADVVVNLTVPGGLTTDVTTLTFTRDNWNVPQTVTVTAANNNTTDGTRNLVITHTIVTSDPYYAGQTLGSVTVVVADPASAAPAAPSSPFMGSGGGFSATDYQQYISSVNNGQSSTTNSGGNTTQNSGGTSGNKGGNGAITVPTPLRFSAPDAQQVSLCEFQRLNNLSSTFDPATLQNIADFADSNFRILVRDFGVILGDEAKDFDPRASVTRSEILRLVLQTKCGSFVLPKMKAQPFPDVSILHKDAIYVATAKAQDIVSGYLHDGTYKPDNNISRAEALKIVLEVLFSRSGFKVQGAGASRIPDVSIADWYYRYVDFAREKGIVADGMPFRPGDMATREDIATFIVEGMRSLSIR